MLGVSCETLRYLLIRHVLVNPAYETNFAAWRVRFGGVKLYQPRMLMAIPLLTGAYAALYDVNTNEIATQR